MIVTFCGQTQINYEPKIDEKIFQTLESEIDDEVVEFYFGNFGWFDSIALSCCKKYKKLVNRFAKLDFITPYMQEDYLRKRNSEQFDEVICPELEEVPKSQTSLARNKWMVEKADLVIGYVNTFGGAYSALAHAYDLDKKIINLGSLDVKATLED